MPDTCTLLVTSPTEAQGTLQLPGATYTVHTRLERRAGPYADVLHITVTRDGREVGRGECVNAADEDFASSSWWCSALVIDGFPWSVEGRRGAGELTFTVAKRLPAKAEWTAA